MAEPSIRGGATAVVELVDPELTPWPEGRAPMAVTIEWLKGTHARFVEHVRALSDSSSAPPPCQLKQTRWLISTILQPDTNHVGETNHIRSFLAEDDRWRWG